MIRLVARIVDQSDGAFQQALLMQKTLVNIHSLAGLTVFFLSNVVVFRFPYQQPMNEISQQRRSDFAFDLRPFLQRTFTDSLRQAHNIHFSMLGCLWSKSLGYPYFPLQSLLLSKAIEGIVLV
jgi:hypothetical protein